MSGEHDHCPLCGDDMCDGRCYDALLDRLANAGIDLIAKDRRIKELEAIVAKLPVYADTGKPFVPTIDKAYSLIQSSLLKAGFVITDGESFISWDANGEIEAEFAGEWWKAAGCYSTPQAAEKASKV